MTTVTHTLNNQQTPERTVKVIIHNVASDKYMLTWFTEAELANDEYVNQVIQSMRLNVLVQDKKPKTVTVTAET